ncbi:NADP oxidoreductase [bacterium]|nr:NADP oxidoreductase [bacterium]
MKKTTMATIWLDGCSGCHMSFLDIDERILELAQRLEITYSPLVDTKSYPDHVDVAVIEGAVSTDEDIIKLKKIRSKTGLIVALGDCAVTGNVPSMRNNFQVGDVLDRAYVENAARQPGRPHEMLPSLLEKVKPVHDYVKVDVHVPGCPPPADAIYYVLSEILEGRNPDPIQMTRFGR